ncbi:hypothetical protein NDS46_07405 [Paenibacillus thiaminolyticus]|nr:hypothetical protein [Paenibacillus thiaminolyticus]WCF09689.1 hypothetical protein NDS46_07405 [Paenibacillus thiaminolyticus]
MEKPSQQDYVGHWSEASIRRVMDAGIMMAGGTNSHPMNRLRGQRLPW